MNNPIAVTVKTEFLAEQSQEQDNKYAFAYQIKIENHGDQQIQLINRYWLITDANGKKSEVRGPGVVGKQPHIAPGSSFQYTSGAILETPFGTMEGFYEMQSTSGEAFEAPIDVFTLAKPNLIN